jgi:hypothetical protein
MNYLLIALFSLAAFATDFPDDPLLEKLLSIDSDSAIKGPAYSKIVEELKSLESAYSEFAHEKDFADLLGSIDCGGV